MVFLLWAALSRWPCQFALVFKSPVWSGFLVLRGLNCNRNRSAFFPEAKKTGPDRKKPRSAVFLRSLGRFRSAAVLTGL
jgi:hypothetical protein